MRSCRQPNGLIERRAADLAAIDEDERPRPIGGDGQLGEEKLQQLDLRLHLQPPVRRNLFLTIAQVLRQGFNRLQRAAERDLRLTDVVQNGEVRTQRVGLGEFAQRPLVVGLAGPLESLGEVHARNLSGFLRCFFSRAPARSVSRFCGGRPAGDGGQVEQEKQNDPRKVRHTHALLLNQHVACHVNCRTGCSGRRLCGPGGFRATGSRLVPRNCGAAPAKAWGVRRHVRLDVRNALRRYVRLDVRNAFAQARPG